MIRIAVIFAGTVGFATGAEPPAAASQAEKDAGAAAWKMVEGPPLKGFEVSISRPVLVARSSGFLWFPTLVPLSSGEVLAMLNNYADEVVTDPTAAVCRSSDKGLTWSKPQAALYGDSNFRLPNGEHLILPYNLHPRPENEIVGTYQTVSQDGREIRVHKQALSVTGLPRPDKPHPKRGVSGFVFNGSGVTLRDGSYLATMYGYFRDSKRLNLLAAHSPDGIQWKIRATIADESIALAGAEGPCEAATCRLKDGRLMCVFRMGSGTSYGQAFSDDEGATWSQAEAIKDVFSVQPCLQVLKCGAITLSGGRPGLYLWINADGLGKSWQRIDLRAHHNALVPAETIDKVTTDEHSQTTAYTRIITTGDNQLLCIYDRAPHGWGGVPKDSADTNSVWVMRIDIQPTAK